MGTIRSIRFDVFRWLFAVILTFWGLPLPCGIPPAATAAQSETPYKAVPGLIDLRTTFSDGAHSIEELVKIARSRGFRVLFINDHHRVELSYGIPPFQRTLRYTKERPSITTHGPEDFLKEISRVSNIYTDTIIIPGCETSPHYYWTGSYFKDNLTAHNYDKKLLIMNFDEPEDYDGIPDPGNRFSLRYTLNLLPGVLVFFVPLIMGVLLLRWERPFRIGGIIIIIVSILGIVDYNPFRGSLFAPHEGDQDIMPYQEVVNYVRERGGFCFWNYPEQRSGRRKLGPISLDTPPYPQDLFESTNYTGFAAIYADNITITEPGNLWDGLLRAYCRGQRERPVWGIATADFHEDGRNGLALGALPTTFLVRSFSKKSILDALRKGRMYCSFGNGHFWPKLDYFHASGNGSERAVMGETLTTSSMPVIRFKVSYDHPKEPSMKIFLIRDGRVIHTVEGIPPMEVEYVDTEAPAGQKTYYRIMDKKKHLISNPIFVTYRPSTRK